jgi:Transposase DDE domain group 1
MTECKQATLRFQEISGKRIEAKFDGGMVSTEAGALILRELCKKRGIFERLKNCFTDYRDAESIEHSVQALLEQRIYGLACGYEDLNDHDILRQDPVFQLLVGKLPELEPKLAGRNTLNRLELSGQEMQAGERYKKIVCNDERMQEFFVEEFVRYAKRHKLKQIVLDCDATDVPLHGKQEGRFFHGYYGHYCYLPLYIFCEEFPLWAELRPSNIDASLGTEEALSKIVGQLRKRLKNIKIIVRGDSGFARDSIMQFCENSGIDYVLGLARNARLESELEDTMIEAKAKFKKTTSAARLFKDFQYKTLDTWSRTRRVIGKAEYLPKGPNPRFIVTSLSRSALKAAELYENCYCKRGEMENHIKEQFQLFSYRLSSGVKRANQLRLWFSTLAYLILVLVKKYALKHTSLANAEVLSIRLKLIKLAAKITVSARRVYLSFAQGFPFQALFATALKNAAA